jgi:hypothetical protein
MHDVVRHDFNKKHEIAWQYGSDSSVQLMCTGNTDQHNPHTRDRIVCLTVFVTRRPGALELGAFFKGGLLQK